MIFREDVYFELFKNAKNGRQKSYFLLLLKHYLTVTKVPYDESH